MIKIPPTVDTQTYAFGYSDNNPSDFYKIISYCPGLSTVVGLDRVSRLFQDSEISLISRIAHFVRALFEIIPFLNLILIPLDLIATIIIANRNKIHQLTHFNRPIQQQPSSEIVNVNRFKSFV